MNKGGKSSGIFYGWWVVWACVLMGLYTSGVINFGFTAVIDPIVKDSGWSYTQVSFASSIRGMETGLLAPVVGLLIDRFGPRTLTFVGGIIIGVGMLLLSSVKSLPMFYVVSIMLAIGTSACGLVTFMATVANWFHRKMSLATGLTMCAYGLSGFMVPVVVGMVDGLGWRKAMSILGLATFFVVLPLSFVVRDRPEKYGYLPDGDPVSAEPRPEISHDHRGSGSSTGLKVALKSRSFWQLSFAYVLQFTLFSAVTTHVMPYLGSIGFARTVSGLVASALAIFSSSGRLGFGWLGDRMSRKLLTAIAFMLEGIAFLFFVGAGAARWLLIPFIIFYSPASGGTFTMRAVLTRGLFGPDCFATLFGIMTGVTIVGSTAGPILAGMVYDRWQSYTAAWLVYGALAIIAAVVVATIPLTKAGDGRGAEK
ncbi:MAG: MFS transporter [Chloroflexota bacterium]